MKEARVQLETVICIFSWKHVSCDQVWCKCNISY